VGFIRGVMTRGESLHPSNGLMERDGATTLRAMGVPFTMDALAAMSSDEEDEEDTEAEEDGGVGERSVVVTKRREIDYEALERSGFRARALVDGARDDGGASVGPTTWGKGIAGGRREGAYTAEESAATRRAVGEGLTETCAEALESARARARARAESEEERRLERAKSRERHLETKRALREDDRAKRAREAEARVNASGSPTPKSRRQKVDLSTRREEEEETKANDVDDETLVATGGFDFGD
jgi:hypothetical protein